MEVTREISALLHLIDDPDSEVFSTVSERIFSYGKPIIPNLENLWENTPDENVQERIEGMIHRLHFQDLQSDVTDFSRKEFQDLIEGVLLVSRYQFPDLATHTVMQDIEKVRRNIWLELNSYLTALEQVNVINRILFTYHKFKGVEVSYQYPEEFLINKVLETKRGNSISNGILYQVLCELLDIPVKAIAIPRQYILAYFDNTHEYFATDKGKPNKIHFFIDPVNGQIYTQKDVENYFKRISVNPVPAYFKPMPNRKIVQNLFEEYSKCYDNDKNRYKQNELNILGDLLA